MLDLVQHISVTTSAICMMMTAITTIAMLCTSHGSDTSRLFLSSLMFVMEHYIMLASICIVATKAKESVNAFIEAIHDCFFLNKRVILTAYMANLQNKSTDGKQTSDDSTNTTVEDAAKNDNMSTNSSAVSGADTHKEEDAK
jgi:hypothetical protein